MNLLARYPNRTGFRLGGYQDVLSLPVKLRDKMLEQLEEWRSQEDSKKS